MGSLGNQTFIGTNLHPDVIRRLDDLIGHLAGTKSDVAAVAANQVTPFQVEAIATGAVAKALLGPLNISNAVGTASGAQKALIPIVKSLPSAVSTALQVGQAVVFDNDIWVWSGTAWILAVQWTFEDTHANRVANYAPGSYVLGTWFYETDRGVWYTNDGTFGSSAWIYKLGTMRGTLGTDQRPAGLGTNDTGFLFYGTDWMVTYRWSGSAWVYQGGIYSAATASRPASLGTNDSNFLFIDTTLELLQQWSGSAWNTIGNTGIASVVIVNNGIGGAQLSESTTSGVATFTLTQPGAWSSYSPTTTNLSSVSTDCTVLQTGKSLQIGYSITGTVVSNSTPITISLPFSPKSNNRQLLFVYQYSGSGPFPGCISISGTTITLKQQGGTTGSYGFSTGTCTFYLEGVIELA